jgi:hypothetical protein
MNMKRILALVVLGLLVASVAFASNDRSRAGEGNYTPGPQGSSNVLPQGDLLICSATAGTFIELSAEYEAAALAAGAASTSVIVETESDAPFPFPSPMTAAEYEVVFLLMADNWWGPNSTPTIPEGGFSATDEAALAAYMDTGGKLYFSGQDYIWGRGNITGFPQLYLGIAAIVEDVNFGDTNVDYTGVTGGAMEGLSGSLVMDELTPPCDGANPFYTDDITPFFDGLADFTSAPSGETGQCGTTYDVVAYKTIFTTLEFGCTDNTGQFQRDVAAIWDWLAGGAVPVEDTTWGSVKEMYK